MKKKNSELIDKLVKDFNKKIQRLDNQNNQGIIRTTKGKLVESLCKEVVKIAWDELDKNEEDLSFPSKKTPIKLKEDYLTKIKSIEVKKWIEDNLKKFSFKTKVDVHVYIKDRFILGIECKSYTENAMLKRILVDFTLLKMIYPKLHCMLFQLESQLTGDYYDINKEVILGSYSTHTLMSYFDINLNILTLLEGERKVLAPIHKFDFFKYLKKETLEKIIEKIKNLMQEN